MSPNEKRMPFLDHLEELRWHLVRSLLWIAAFAGVAWFFREEMFAFLTRPYRQGYGADVPLIYLAPVDPFIVNLKIAITTGVIGAFPFILYEGWKFIAPGLLIKERRYVPLLIFLTMLCFLVGAAFAYFFIIPWGLSFFFGFQTEHLQASVEVNRYITFVVQLILAFGLVFELPMVSLVLGRIGILTPALMRRIRPYAVITMFVLAALITPPDVVSQVALGLPLIALWEISIYVVAIFGRRPESEEDPDDDAPPDSDTPGPAPPPALPVGDASDSDSRPPPPSGETPTTPTALPPAHAGEDDVDSEDSSLDPPPAGPGPEDEPD